MPKATALNQGDVLLCLTPNLAQYLETFLVVTTRKGVLLMLLNTGENLA